MIAEKAQQFKDKFPIPLPINEIERIKELLFFFGWLKALVSENINM